MWDNDTFLRPTAHRGHFTSAPTFIENTWPAFAAAIDAGLAIECDIQRTKDHVAVIFHDFTLDRLIDGSGPLKDFTYPEVQACRYKDSDETILTLADLFDRVRGRVPLLLELKSDWGPPDTPWMARICERAASYGGPVALMSFDPALMQITKELARDLPRGLVSGNYRHPDRASWWPDEVDDARARSLTNLHDIDTVEPDFIAYHVKDLDTPPVANARQNLGLPIMTWTVRSDRDWQLCNAFADAAIFEGKLPDRD